ncbi:SusD/RagB family nutrient-binding outer membrane lipoprotein [Chitinophaga oryziterrae]|uniref:SusD/RagB family nutrient-binding outer membrane lipoprotein n=1 Tax=Chitinophaga oryziterrae TaxID=1031224 RepID=A0A6N8J2C8_9BACT|nr:SusD/RagB family nutrient-binding outer membrane lipoprotein [Chitinophaga oryziterrae]MVT39367.1 SusD/RagB family nutrient-binding outer membrane lipoprotein [Chitinophaga oryziterrae]
MLRTIKYILPMLTLLLVTQGCKKAYFYNGINDDPSQLKAPTPSAILPGAILSSAYTWGGDASRFASIFMQQVTGAANQSASYNSYVLTPDDVDNMWYAGFYGAIMTNVDTLIRIAESKGQGHYAAVGKILMANDLGEVTDYWGDVPYTEAFQGLNNTQPKYDSQKALYDTLQSLLDQAITALSSDDGSAFQPGSSDDLLFNGDLGLWLRFAHSLKAKFYLHVVKVDGTALAKAKAQIADGFADGEGAFVKFVGSSAATTQAPWFQFNDQRADITFDGYLNDLLLNSEDPRYSVYYDPSDGTLLGSLYGSANSPVYFMSYDELKFIEAEVAFRNSDKTTAAASYNEAVRANLQRTVGSTTYLATVMKTSATITLKDIMVQKYIALFLDPEVWTDWRRTGYPVLTAPANNSLNGALPRSVYYPSSEVRYNKNTPANTTLTRRVWWDVE